MSKHETKRPKPMGKKKWKRFLALVNGVLGQSSARATREVLRAQTEAARADRAEMNMLEWKKKAQGEEFALCLLKMKLSAWAQKAGSAETVALRTEEIEEALRMVEEGRSKSPAEQVGERLSRVGRTEFHEESSRREETE